MQARRAEGYFEERGKTFRAKTHTNLKQEEKRNKK